MLSKTRMALRIAEYFFSYGCSHFDFSLRKMGFRISLLRNPIIIADAAVLISGITGQMESSATKTFFVPYTRVSPSTTPPAFRGAILQCDVKWCTSSERLLLFFT